MTRPFGTCIATTEDWLLVSEGQGMKLMAFDPACLSLARSISYSTVISTSGQEKRFEVPSARRSLRSKAREEMSDFDRNYSW
jgi:hypothetical protein